MLFIVENSAISNVISCKDTFYINLAYKKDVKLYLYNSSIKFYSSVSSFFIECDSVATLSCKSIKTNKYEIADSRIPKKQYKSLE